MMDYVIVEKSVSGRWMDVHVPREAGGRVFDHFLIEARVQGGLVIEEGEKGCSAGKS